MNGRRRPSRWRAAIATVFLSTLGGVRAGAEVWTLDQAVSAAVRNSPDAAIARNRVAEAESLIEQARSAWLPLLSLEGRYAATDSPMQAFGSILNERAFNFGLDFNHPGTVDELAAGGSLRYNLYRGGRDSARLAASTAGSRAAQYEREAARHAIETEVIRAYLGLRKARDGVTALAAGAEAYESAVAVSRARFRAGQLLKADLLSLEVELAETRANLAAARNGATLAAEAFLCAIGGDVPGEAVEILPDDPALARLVEPPSGDYSRRPDLLALEQRVRSAEEEVREAKGARNPSLNAFAGYEYDRGFRLNHDGEGWMAGVALDLDLFDGGQTSGRIRQSVAAAALAREEQRKAVLQTRLEVERLRLAHADAKERLEIGGPAVEAAEESAAQSRARFEKGGLLAAELIGVESRLVAARLRRAAALADERAALAELRCALGFPPLPEPSTPIAP